jgi:hypothetical protein
LIVRDLCPVNVKGVEVCSVNRLCVTIAEGQEIFSTPHEELTGRDQHLFTVKGCGPWGVSRLYIGGRGYQKAQAQYQQKCPEQQINNSRL